MNLRVLAVWIGAAARRVAVFSVVLLFATGCVSLKEQGDRAYEAADYKKAKTFYDQAIEEGSEDPKLYLQAARTALQLGSLASAEQLYARALRFGGGTRVAKELARYYVQTSNYASAVRVYQYLLYQTDEPQAVYNNLGTALLYAGQPFDAESYLLVAQQMEPDDPLPYLNLGLLYDEHLKQPWLAINFYECFAELSGDREQTRRARQRVSELESKWSQFYDPGALDCGKVYTAKHETTAARTRGAVDLEVDLGFDEEQSDADTEGEGAEVVIDRMVESLPESAADREKDKKAGETSSPLEGGRTAFAEKRWNEAVVSFQAVPLSELEVGDLEMLGASLYKLGKYEDSVQWLEIVATRQPSPDSVKLLIDAYFRGGDFEGVARTCERWASNPKTPGVNEHCRERIEMLPGAPEAGSGPGAVEKEGTEPVEEKEQR